MNKPDFYLASTEGYDLEEPRCCWRIKQLRVKGYNDFLLIKIDPPLIGQKYGIGAHDINFLLLAPRHQGASLFPVSEWPISVHVARFLIEKPENRDTLEPNEFELIAWAELYKTKIDANRKGR